MVPRLRLVAMHIAKFSGGSIQVQLRGEGMCPGLGRLRARTAIITQGGLLCAKRNTHNHIAGIFCAKAARKDHNHSAGLFCAKGSTLDHLAGVLYDGVCKDHNHFAGVFCAMTPPPPGGRFA